MLIYDNEGRAFTRSPKTDAEGKQLYLLPQEPLEIRTPVTRRVESAWKTSEPVMVAVRNTVPHLDTEGVQVSYIPTVPGEVLEDTGEPIMVPDDEGTLVQKTDEQDRPLFMGQVPHPAGEAARIFCTTVEEVEVQKTDADGDDLLYWNTVEDEAVTYEPQEPLEITQDDERYTEDLEEAFVLEPYELPAAPVTMTAEQRLSELEAAHKDVKRTVQINGEKVDATSADLQAFMDYTFDTPV